MTSFSRYSGYISQVRWTKANLLTSNLLRILCTKNCLNGSFLSDSRSYRMAFLRHCFGSYNGARLTETPQRCLMVFIMLKIRDLGMYGVAAMCAVTAVTRYCLAVLLAGCSTLPVHCKQSSVVQQTFALLVAGCSQLTQTVVWDDHGCCPLECVALAGRLKQRYGYASKRGQRFWRYKILPHWSRR